jgi:uncharacterized membrane protein YdjX (TVP38/TMEM64 family)
MKRFSWTKTLPLLALMLGLAAFFYFRLYEYISFQALKTHRELLLLWSKQNMTLFVTAFIVVYVLLTAFCVPVMIFMTITGGFIFGPFWATLYVAIGATTGATITFLATKTALAAFLREKTGGWFKKISSEFENNAVSYMLFLRLVPLFPFFVVNIITGFLGIRLRVFVITTFFGALPGTFVYALLGGGVGSVLERGTKVLPIV